jgi:hypothetical protein
VDTDADGIAAPDERRLPGVRITGAGSDVVTGSTGEGFVTGLGNNPKGAFRVETAAIDDDVFLTSPPQDVTFAPRAGQVLRVTYPFTPTSEVIVRLEVEQDDGRRVGLSALRFNLVAESGRTVPGSTEFDGTAVLEDVKPGRYDLQLDPEQAGRLKLRLSAPVKIEVTPESGQVSLSGTIIFERGTE